MFLYKVLELRGVVFPCKRVRVVAVGQEAYFDVHSLFEQHVYTPDRRFDSRHVAVIEHGDIVGETVNQPDLSRCQGRTGRGHYVFHPRLVHRDHVRISFHKEAAVLLYDGLFGKVDAVKFVAFMINFRLRRVDILGEFLVFRTEHTPAERNHFARKRVDREHDTSPEAVTQFMVVRLIAKPRLYEKLFFEAFAHRLLCQSVTPFSAEPQLEFVDNIITEASLAEVSQSDAASVYVVFQDVLEIVAGEVVDNEHTFSVALHLFLFIGQLPFLDFYIIFLGQIAECFGVGHLFVLHDKVHRVTALTATEAFAKSL
ncbi:uncharacterized protein BN707_03299 [Bacteroides fragilis CAG:558]|nr:uncharacterized protein BN707_03299 [Bacteroides fragilis CAG:558]